MTKFRSFTLPLLSLLALTVHLEARSFPPTASRSFRFPDHHHHHEDGWSNSIKDTNVVEAKNAHIGRSNNIPSSSDQKSSIMKDEFTGFSEFVKASSESAEVVEVEVGLSKENSKTSKEDEELRDVLCPPTKANTKTTSDAEGKETSFESDGDAHSRIRYDLLAGKCAHVGRKEHCGENMIFVADIDSSAYGYCECDFENKLGRKSGEKRGRGEGTPLVFHQETKSCVRLYEQAYCKEGEWLVLSRKEKGPICEPRKCPVFPAPFSIVAGDEHKLPGEEPVRSERRRNSKLLTPTLWIDAKNSSTKEASSSKLHLEKNDGKPGQDVSIDGQIDKHAVWVPLNGAGPCVELNKENKVYCDKGEHILFKVGIPVPKCGIPGRDFEARAVIYNACPPGSFFSIIGRCQPDWEF